MAKLGNNRVGRARAEPQTSFEEILGLTSRPDGDETRK